MNQPTRKTMHKNPLVAFALIVAVVLLGGVMTNQKALAGSLTNMNWATSSNMIGVTSQQYTWNFTTATTGTIKSVTFTVPATTAGTAANVAVYGLGAGTWSGPTAGVITYTVTSAVSIGSGVQIYAAANGITNPTATGSFSSVITTQTSAPATIDSGTASSVTFANNQTAVTIVIPESMTFTNDTSAFTLIPVPSGSAATKAVTLTVQTNAKSGYSLTASNTSLTNGTQTLAEMTTSGAASLVLDQFAAQGTCTGCTIAAPYNSSNYVGYGSSATAVASHGVATGTTADTVVLTNAIQVDYGAGEGSFTSTITYVVTPSY